MPEERMLRWFVFEHLKEPMRTISSQFSQLAHDMCGRLHPGPERTVMLRKLLEAKDAAVRQQIEDTTTT
jgi:predicted NAD-dependent protein-ADP-ribosyltransferase YbiA (DUF1768 family)